MNSNSTRLRPLHLSLLLALVAMLAVAALALRDPGGAAASGPITEAEARAEIGPVLGIFRRDQTAEEITAGELAATQPVAELIDGENMALMRIVALPIGKNMHIWPAHGAVCFSIYNGAGCAPIESIRDGGVTVGSAIGPDVALGKVRVFGVARDGIPSLSVTLDGAPAVSAGVVENVFAVDVAGAPLELQWTDASGLITVPVPFESDLLTNRVDGSGDASDEDTECSLRSLSGCDIEIEQPPDA